MVLPKPARLIAAIIFIALVASAIHFLATKPSSGALTTATRNSLYYGTLDDVRLYNRAHSATEIKQLYNAGR